MVQRKAARFVFGDYSTYSSVFNMLQELQWNSLQERKLQARLIMFYKIVHNEVEFESYGNINQKPKFRQLPTRLNIHSYQPPSVIGTLFLKILLLPQV